MTARSVFIALQEAFIESLRVFWALVKVMVPVIIGVKILKEAGLIVYLAWPLEPIMGLVGLPAEMGLVWATGIINGFYPAVALYASLTAGSTVTVEQVTVLSLLLLFAHGLPVELKVARMCGPTILGQAFFRLGGAFLCGWIFHIICTTFGLFQQAGVSVWQQGEEALTLWGWAVGEVRNFASLFVVVFFVFLAVRILDWLKVTHAMRFVLRPVLTCVGISPSAATVTVVGLTLGISFGSGVIVKEARSGSLKEKDIFYSLTLMGQSHSLIEDTLITVFLGATLWGALGLRVVFSLVALFLLVQVVNRLPASFFHRWLMHDPL